MFIHDAHVENYIIELAKRAMDKMTDDEIIMLGPEEALERALDNYGK